MIVTIYSNIAIFVQVFVGSVGYSIYCDIPTNKEKKDDFSIRLFKYQKLCLILLLIS